MTDNETIETIKSHLLRNPWDQQARRELIDLLMDAGREEDTDVHRLILHLTTMQIDLATAQMLNNLVLTFSRGSAQ